MSSAAGQVYGTLDELRESTCERFELIGAGSVRCSVGGDAPIAAKAVSPRRTADDSFEGMAEGAFGP